MLQAHEKILSLMLSAISAVCGQATDQVDAIR